MSRLDTCLHTRENRTRLKMFFPLLAGMLGMYACHRAGRPLTWETTGDAGRAHPTPPVDLGSAVGPSCVRMPAESHEVAPESVAPSSSARWLLMAPDCAVKQSPAHPRGAVECEDERGPMLPLPYWLWHRSEYFLPQLREPSLIPASRPGITREFRITSFPTQFGTILAVRYTERGDRGTIVSKRMMQFRQNGASGDFFREYPRREIGPAAIACVRSIVEAAGLWSSPETFYWEQPEPSQLCGDWVIEAREDDRYRVMARAELNPTEGLGLLFSYLLNLSGVDAD